MKFLVLLLAIQVASIQAGAVISPVPEPRCEITDAALEELGQLRAIVEQLKTLVETLISRPIEPPKPDSECQRQVKEIEGRGLSLGAYKPTCTDEGKFTPQQCHPSTGHCWCVDEETGAEVQDTRSGPTGDRIECVVIPVPVCEDVGCTADWVPVCGSDGRTYSNLCGFENAQCLDPSLTYTEGECSDDPVCEDGACTADWVPVCGSDRRTYSNLCGFERAQCLDPFLTYTDGECAEVNPCSLILCDVPRCPEGYVVAQQLQPGECCPGCVLEDCQGVPCDELPCPEDVQHTYEGQCCPECPQDWGLDPCHLSGTCGLVRPVNPCVLIQCSIPRCPEGFVVEQQLPPGQCCPGCVLEDCQGVLCDELPCPEDVQHKYEGQCCPECPQDWGLDPCHFSGTCGQATPGCDGVQCDPPICELGFELGEIEGECCPGCIENPCAGILCEEPICTDGYELALPGDGECCSGCSRLVFEDCANAQTSGMTNNGAYLIQPIGVPDPFEAWCDFEDAGGRWTVVLRRQESDINFLRNFDEYVQGFGDATGAYWIGLENLYRLNKNGNTKMFVKGTDFLGVTASGQYNIFRIGAADTDYTLEAIVGFRGTADANIGNALAFNKGAAFSAPDRDSDNGDRNCAEELAGGWWHKGSICTRTNPLGEFLIPDEFGLEKGIFWAPYRGKGKSLQFLELKVRPA